MSFAKYREKLFYQAPNFTQNSTSKDYAPNWGTSTGFFGHVTELTGRESEQDNRIVFINSIQVETHLNNIDWNNRARLTWRGDQYYIVSVQKFHDENRVFIIAEQTDSPSL